MTHTHEEIRKLVEAATDRDDYVTLGFKVEQLLSELDTKDKEIERLKGALENIGRTTVDNISEVKAHRALKGVQDDE